MRHVGIEGDGAEGVAEDVAEEIGLSGVTWGIIGTFTHYISAKTVLVPILRAPDMQGKIRSTIEVPLDI